MTIESTAAAKPKAKKGNFLPFFYVPRFLVNKVLILLIFFYAAIGVIMPLRKKIAILKTNF